MFWTHMHRNNNWLTLFTGGRVYNNWKNTWLEAGEKGELEETAEIAVEFRD